MNTIPSIAGIAGYIREGKITFVLPNGAKYTPTNQSRMEYYAVQINGEEPFMPHIVTHYKGPGGREYMVGLTLRNGNSLRYTCRTGNYVYNSREKKATAELDPAGNLLFEIYHTNVITKKTKNGAELVCSRRTDDGYVCQYRNGQESPIDVSELTHESGISLIRRLWTPEEYDMFLAKFSH